MARWGGNRRLPVVESPSIRSLPGYFLARWVLQGALTRAVLGKPFLMTSVVLVILPARRFFSRWPPVNLLLVHAAARGSMTRLAPARETETSWIGPISMTTKGPVQEYRRERRGARSMACRPFHGLDGREDHDPRLGLTIESLGSPVDAI